MAFTTGYNAHVSINSMTLCATKFSVSTKVDEIDVTSFCDTGYASWLGGSADCDITIEGVLGTDQSEDPYNVLAFRDLGDLKIGSQNVIIIYPDQTLNGGATWTFPIALLCSWSMEGSPRDTVRWTLTAKANGVYTEPDM